MTDYLQPRSTPRWRTWTAWTCQILLALAFLAAGGQKLLGTQAMVELFSAIGLGQWFRLLTGILEVTAAILLLIPAAAAFGAALALCIMAGAIAAHLGVIGGSALPAAVLFCLAAVVLGLRRPA